MRYFVERWYAAVPLPRLFWRDMIAVGTLINLATTLASVIAWDLGSGAVTATLLFFAPAPYNAFLVIAVWRATQVLPQPGRAGLRITSVLWLVLVTLI